MMVPRIFPLVLAFPLLLGAGNISPPVPNSMQLDYVIKRDGDPIGKQVITFTRRRSDLLVDTKIDIAVKIMFITVYRYEKSALETWRGGKIVAYRTNINDNGKLITGQIVLRPNGLAVNGQTNKIIAPSGTMISGYWNMATIKQTALIDSEDISLVPITVGGGEAASIIIGGRNYQTQHYRITGELARELWYDREGLLIKMRAIGSNGSVIDTERNISDK